VKIKLGLVGKNIAHSKSQEMYEKIYNQKIDYTLFDFNNIQEILPLDSLFSQVEGVSITAPYKKHFLKDCIVSDEIRELGAINCIRKCDEVFEGTNTDLLASREILSRYNSSDNTFVVLGSGSMAKMILKIFKERSIDLIHLYRRRDGPLDKLDLTQYSKDNKRLFIINACAREFEFNGQLSQNSIFWDLNYSHSGNFNYLSERCTYFDGEELLYLQAIYATKFWNFKP